MSFSVHTAALHTFGSVLTANETAASKASAYVKKYVKIESSGLVINPVYSNTPAVASTIASTLDHLASICRCSAAEIAKTASLYDHTDTTSAARLDAAYHDPAAGSVDPKTGALTQCKAP